MEEAVGQAEREAKAQEGQLEKARARCLELEADVAREKEQAREAAADTRTVTCEINAKSSVVAIICESVATSNLLATTCDSIAITYVLLSHRLFL